MTAGPLTLTVLGCDGSYPGPGGASSGYLVQYQGASVWLDAGSGTFANLQRYVAIEDLDAVVITHEHVDHWSDLEHLAVAARYVVVRDDVPLYCEPDLVSAMRTASAATVLAWSRIGPGSKLDIGGMTFTFSRTDHPVNTLAVRVDAGGRSLGYSADSGPEWGLAQLGPGLDLALCEATFLSEREDALGFHMSAKQAGATARAAGVAKLVITHLWPRTDRRAAEEEAAASFGGPVHVASIGDRFEV
ncbi:MAG: MBL fold metallo-hydrolase [Acidimicrobiales bacterium]|nr:MBL fold metallo-hydrolase [Acidimicrobiales bacterium]